MEELSSEKQHKTPPNRAVIVISEVWEAVTSKLHFCKPPSKHPAQPSLSSLCRESRSSSTAQSLWQQWFSKASTKCLFESWKGLEGRRHCCCLERWLWLTEQRCHCHGIPTSLVKVHEHSVRPNYSVGLFRGIFRFKLACLYSSFTLNTCAEAAVKWCSSVSIKVAKQNLLFSVEQRN